MKDLYTQIMSQQDFGYQDEYYMQKKMKLFEDKTKLITDKIKLYVYRVNYSYKTKRGNLKENYKIIILNRNDKTEAKFKLMEYLTEFNQKYPFRAISNVKILDISFEEILLPLI